MMKEEGYHLRVLMKKVMMLKKKFLQKKIMKKDLNLMKQIYLFVMRLLKMLY